jgi:hypothetical protein
MEFPKDITEFKMMRFKFSNKFFSFIKFRFIRYIARAGIIITFEDRELFTLFPET